MQRRGCVPGHRNMGLLEEKGDLGQDPEHGQTSLSSPAADLASSFYERKL